MKAKFLKILASGLVLWLALNWLGLVFIPMAINPNHSVTLVESRSFILYSEIVVCLATIGWGIVQIRNQRREN